MKLNTFLDYLGTDTKVRPLFETKQVGYDNFKFSNYSSDKRHNNDYNTYSINPMSVIPHGLIDVIKVKNDGLLGEFERGGQSNAAGLNGNIKRYIKRLAPLTKGDSDLGWDGGNVSKAMTNTLQKLVVEYMEKGEYLTPFKWDRLIREYSNLISRYVDPERVGALPTNATSTLPTGEDGAVLSEYVAYLIVRDVIAPKFIMKRKLDDEESVNRYKARVEKLGFLGDIDDTGGGKGAYEAEYETPPQISDPFGL